MYLTKMSCLSLPIMLMFLVTGTASAEDDSAVTVDISADYYGKYIWRGQNIDDKSVLQPNVSVGAFGFTGSIWANIDLTNQSQTAPNNAGEFSEIDYTLDYSSSIPGTKILGFSLGVIHYLFPNTSFNSTTELYGGLSLDVPLNPSFTWYRDVDVIEGSYLQLGLGHTFEKLVAWNNDYYLGLDLSGSIAWASSGYNDGYFGIDANKFNDVTIGIGVPITLKHLTISPSLNISSMLSERIGMATYEGNRNNVWFGVGISKSF